MEEQQIEIVVEEFRGTKYVDAGCSMPIISYLAFGLITANTFANLIQVSKYKCANPRIKVSNHGHYLCICVAGVANACFCFKQTKSTMIVV